MRFNRGRWAAGLVATVGCGLATATPARAAIRVDERLSTVQASASTVGFFGDADSDFKSAEESTPTPVFSSIVTVLAESVGAEASSRAAQNSNLNYTNGNLSGARGSGDVDVSATFSSGSGTARALSDFLLRFTIPAGEVYDFALTGRLEAPDRFRASGSVFLTNTTGGGETVVASAAGDAGAFAFSGELRPGEYELDVEASGGVVATGFGDSQYEFNFTLTPDSVPEPAAATFLVLPAALLMRRHRRT